MAKLFFLAILPFSLSATEIKILYRASVSPLTLNFVSQTYYGIREFRMLTLSQRKALEFLVDPWAMGHVAIEFPKTELSESEITGWEPVADEFGNPIDPEDLSGLDSLFRHLQSSTFQNPKSIYNFVLGRFVDNTQWAKGAALDPVYEIPITVTEAQIDKLREAINLLNLSGKYQLVPNVTGLGNSQTMEFPKLHFNCVIAIKQLFAYAKISAPFSFGEGFMCGFAKAASPFSKKRPCSSYLLEKLQTYAPL